MPPKKMKLSTNKSDDSISESDEPEQNDFYHLLQIFPAEMWEKILDQIQDSETLENLSNATLLFRSLLLPKRVEFLFPKVFPFFAAKLERPRAPLLSLESCEMMNYFERVAPQFQQDHKLRKVCQAWNKSVQTFYTIHTICTFDDPLLIKIMQDVPKTFTIELAPIPK